MDYKTYILITYALSTSLSKAEIVINDYTSIEGFVDTSYIYCDQEFATVERSDTFYGLDQIELDCLFDYGPLAAQIDFHYENSDRKLAKNLVEQAFISYERANYKLTAGRFASQLGFEAFEPTGLYQYSRAYIAAEGDSTSELMNFNDGVLPYYDQGLKCTFFSDTSYYGIALVKSLSSASDNQSNALAIELAGSLFMGQGLSIFAGARLNDYELTKTNETVVNAYITYQLGAFVFAAELVFGEREVISDSDVETRQGLIMMNYCYSKAASISGRLSRVELQAGSTKEDFTKYTLSHGYALAKNLFLVNEFSLLDGQNISNDYQRLSFATEVLLTF